MLSFEEYAKKYRGIENPEHTIGEDEYYELENEYNAYLKEEWDDEEEGGSTNEI